MQKLLNSLIVYGSAIPHYNFLYLQSLPVAEYMGHLSISKRSPNGIYGKSCARLHVQGGFYLKSR